MLTAEREQFEVILEFHDELREFVSGLSEVGAAVALALPQCARVSPSPNLKARLAGLIAGRQQQTCPEGLVVSGPDRLVHWVNPAFSEMCGYSLEELRGKNLGPILQGEKTDRATAGSMRLSGRCLSCSCRLDSSSAKVCAIIKPFATSKVTISPRKKMEITYSTA